MNPKLEHNRFVVNDLNSSIEFYKKLGFQPKWTGTQPTGENWVHIHLGDFYLSLSQRTVKKNLKPKLEQYEKLYGFLHMGWVIHDLKVYKRILQTNNIPFKEIETQEGSHLYFFDPDNNEIELIEYKNQDYV
ncbi:MAG: VOC family protein [Flavobacteriales bacterium]|nr:VOC family protein [Flavobacteriales bacterium]